MVEHSTRQGTEDPEADGTGDLVPGAVVAGYRIEERIGAGGMGVVFRARDPELDRSVALKLIAAGRARDPRFRRMFIRESLAAASLEHPNVVPIYRAGEDGGHLYLAMRFVEGESLADMIAERGRLAPGHAARIVAQAAAALDAAHAAGLVHGDVKPANLLIANAEAGGQVLLTDFGLSRRVGEAADGSPERSGWVGTLSYLAPEQIRGEIAGPAADVYALGCLLFHALTGRVPFAGDEGQVLSAHLTAEPPRPSERVPGLPAGFDDVVRRALAKRPDDRWATAGELADAAMALRADVFLCHHPHDAASVARLAGSLRDEGLVPWAASGDERPEWTRREERLEGLRSSTACAVVVGADGLGEWAREELAVAQELAARDRGFRLVMVLLPGAPDPFDPRLAFLAARAWVDLRADEADMDGLRALGRAIRGEGHVLARPTPSGEDVCPYRGLEAFHEEHTGFFVGREEETARALEHLRAGRFLAVVGPSGSGKSSLVRAGILPALSAGGIPGGGGWSTCVLNPGPRPLAALVATLERAVPAPLSDEALRADARALDRAVQAALAPRPPADRLVLVIDQFEELFTLCRDEGERTAFIENLVYAATIPAGRTVVILGLRADFYARCAAYPALGALVASRQLLVGPLGPEELRRAIEEPARAAGLALEDGLARTIQDDVGRRPGALPLLEHVLSELWRRRRGRLLTTDAYGSSGGLEGALAKRANEIFAGLPAPQQDTARRILLRLTQPGEGAEDTRRRALMSELAKGPEEEESVSRVVEALAGARLLTVGRDEASGETTVEVAHEALIRGWPRLRRWIDDDRDALRLHRRLTESASEWEASGREDGLLYAGARLAPWQHAEPSGDLNPLERAFLAASIGQATRRRRLRRRQVRAMVGGLAAVAVVIAAIAALALVQREQAADERDIAVSRQLAVSAADQLAGDPQLGLLLALRAWDAAPTEEAEEQLRQATFASRAAGVLGGHDAPVKDAVFSSDGRTAWSAGEDGTVRAFDVAGRRAGTVLRTDDLLQAVAVSPDGRHVAAAGNAGTVWIWDLASGVRQARRGHEGAIYTVAFSPDGRLLASAGEDTTVRVWRVDGSGRGRVLRGHTDIARGALFTLDGRSLVSISSDRTVRLWDVASGRTTRVLQAGQSLRSLGVGPAGAIVAGTDGAVWQVLYWPAPRGKPRVAGRHSNEVYGVAIAPDGRTLASTGADGTVRVWDVGGGPPRAVLEGHVGIVTNVVFDPSGRLMLTPSLDNTVRLWEVARERLPTVLWGPKTATLDEVLSPDGRHVIVGEIGAAGGAVHVYRRSGGRPVATLRGPASEVWGVDVSSDGRYIAAGSAFEAAWVWDWRSGRRLARLTDGGGAVDVAFSHDGRLLAGAGQDGIVRVWDWRSGHLLRELSGHGGTLWSVSFSPDGRRLASAGQDGTARIRSWPEGDTVSVLRGHQGTIWQVEFSADGARAVTAGDDRTVRVWDVASGRQLALLRGHSDSANAAVFGPDGDLVASASADDTTRVWDWRRGVQVEVFRGFHDATTVVMSPEGDRVIAGDGAGVVRVLPCETCGPIDDVVDLARKRAVRSLTAEEQEVLLPSP